MNFTELEILLVAAVGVLLWRIRVLEATVDEVVDRADRYAGYLKGIYHKQGTVKKDPTRGYYYEANDERPS